MQLQFLSGEERKQFVGNFVWPKLTYNAYSQADTSAVIELLLDESVVDYHQLLTDQKYFWTKVNEATEVIQSKKPSANTDTMWQIHRPWTQVEGIPANQMTHTDKLRIKVMQWNILAQSLVTQDSFPRVPPEYLTWEHRLPLIIEHIRFVDADIVGLCEVDPEAQMYQQQLLSELSKLGYKYVVKEKSNFLSGSALLWKENRVSLVDYGTLPFADSPQFLLYGKFEIDGKHIIFCQTHLKAGGGFKDLRVKQTEAILNFFTEHYADLPVLVAGDFNDSP